MQTSHNQSSLDEIILDFSLGDDYYDIEEETIRQQILDDILAGDYRINFTD